MEPNKPKCKLHGGEIGAVCVSCKRPMCFKCLDPHDETGCKGGVMSLPSYAKKNLVPRFDEILKDLESRREKLEGSANAIAGMLPGVKQNLHALKGMAEKLLADISNALASLEECGPDSSYATVKSEVEQQLNELKIATANDDTECIIRVMESPQSIPAGAGDAELRLIEQTSSAVVRLMAVKEFATLGECLQGLVATCRGVFSRKVISRMPEVTSRFVYGVCSQVDCYKKLCRYNLVAKKITPCADVQQYCSVLQVGKRIFVSGGGEPVVDTVSEFVEETQHFVRKAAMKYAKRCHASIAVSTAQFMTIGGYTGGPSIAYCEEYSIQNDTWKQLPSLNQARCQSGASLSGDGSYIYVIGGTNGNGIIERLDMKKKVVWDKVAVLSGEAEVSLNCNSVAFPISTDEIMIFVGDAAPYCGVYNVKTGTVKKHARQVKPDSYCCNSVCMINGDAYVIGGQNAHLHICRIASKKIEEIDYHDASA